VPYVVRIIGRSAGDATRKSIYEEVLFDLRTGSPDAAAVLSFRDDAGVTNWIPGFCYNLPVPRPQAFEAAAICSNGFPDHDTLTVLALVNQIWGLQKEPSAAAQSILTLGG